MAFSEPAFPLQSGTVLVVGSAPCVFDDVRDALNLRPDAKLLALNEAGGAFPHIDFLYAGHYDKMPVFLEYRKNQQPDGNTDFSTHANWVRGRVPVPEVDYWWQECVSGATSAWTAARMAAGMGFDEIILCGCPLELSGYYNDPKSIKHDCRRVGLDERTLNRYRERFLVESARDNLPARSMSGWTRDQLGGTMRAEEVAKYQQVYRMPAYRMGDRRKRAAISHLSDLPRGSYLDVGTGRGEMLDIAEDLGFSPVQGTEVVDYLLTDRVTQAYAHALPFESGQFDVVSMFDVMEHLLPEDAEAACRELDRVAGKAVLLTVANFSHVVNGMELHINRRPYADWEADFHQWFTGKVERLPRLGSISETWVVRYSEVSI